MGRTNLANLLLDVDKSSGLHLVQQLWCRVEGLTELARTLADVGHPELGVRCQLSRVIVGEEARVNNLHLQVATGGQMLESSAEELIVIGDASTQLAGVDVVELGAVDPILFEIIDLKRAVRRCPVF